MASATAPLFAQQEKSAFPVEIKISGKPYQAVLFDNATGRAIRSQLPTDNVAYTRYEVGEIVYWPPRHSFVIMYAQNGEMFDMQKIGKILSPLPTHLSGDVEIEITAGN